MKKLLTIGMALTMCSTTIGGTVDAYTATMDSLNQASTVSVARARQTNYLDALRIRYQKMYNQSLIYPGYKNAYLQQDSLKQTQQENNIIGSNVSGMTRTGEMEQDKERVRKVNTQRVQAVNAKQTFRKAAIDYYVLGGTGYSNSAAMSMGNVDAMTNVVPRSRMVGDMFKVTVGATNLTTRDMVRNIGLNQGNTGIQKPSTYSTGQFNSRMMSPYMSTRWMQ